MASSKDRHVFWSILTAVSVIILVFTVVSGTDATSQTDRSSKCSSAMTKVLESAYAGVGWAVEMVDASFKPPIGITRLGFHSMFMLERVPMGSLQFLGNYDQCLDVEPSENFGTLYCRIHIQVESLGNHSFSPPKNVYADICASDLCEGNDDLLPFAMKYLKQVPNLKATVQGTTCQQRVHPYTNKTIATMCFMSVLLVVVAVATAYDAIVRHDSLGMFSNTSDTKTTATTTTTTTTTTTNKDQKVKRVQPGPGEIGQLLLPFSLYTNVPELLSTNAAKGSFTSINSIRSFTVLWIIYGHFIGFGEPAMENISTYSKKINPTWWGQITRLSPLGVDNFFTMSSLLLTFKMMKELETLKPTWNYFKGLFFHRYLRLTAVYLLIMATHTCLFKHLSDGPFWPQGDIEPNECGDWWKNALYINNYGNPFTMCMTWTWSLGLEMQFFIISPLFILPLYYYDWKGLIVPVLSLTVSALYTLGVSYYNNLAPVIELDDKNIMEYLIFYYVNPLARVTPYFVGIITGFLLYRTNREAKLSKNVVIAGWTMSTIVAFVVLFFTYGHVNGNPLSNEMRSLYNAFHRPLFSMAICWVIFACTCGYGGMVNTFLSWGFFTPISRLSYCVYLIQIDVIRHFLYSRRRMFYLDSINIMYSFIGVLVMTYAVSAVAYLIFEVPWGKLERAIRRIRENRTKLHQS